MSGVLSEGAIYQPDVSTVEEMEDAGKEAETGGGGGDKNVEQQ